MRHRNIFRLTAITILTFFAATSSVVLVVSYWERMVLHNFTYLHDLGIPDGCLVGIQQGSLRLCYARQVSDDDPWTDWRFGFKNFGIVRQSWVHSSQDKISLQWRYYLDVPLIVLVLAFAAYPLIAFVRGPLRRYRRGKAGCCQKCGYSLVGNVSGVCPECGTKI